MATFSATIAVKYDMTWDELKAEVEAAGIPGRAKPDPFVDDGYGPMDPGSKELRFTWRTP
jgi:hypothetical protein